MCLIVFAFKTNTHLPLVLAANRDEFFDRPTRAMGWWPQAPELLAGQDLMQGGIWFGITRDGRFAAVTNYRGRAKPSPARPRSRGELPLNFLRGDLNALDYLTRLQQRDHQYEGFNLLLGTPEEMAYYSNVERRIKALEPGIYGLANDLLDTPWPKVVRAKARLETWLAEPPRQRDRLLDAMLDLELAADEHLPDTGVPLEVERALSAGFVRWGRYGTRSSTVMVMSRREIEVTEREYDDRGATVADRAFAFTLAGEA